MLQYKLWEILLDVFVILGLVICGCAGAEPVDLDAPPDWTYDYWISFENHGTDEDSRPEMSIDKMGAQAKAFRLMCYHYVRYLSDRGGILDPVFAGRDPAKEYIERRHANNMKAIGYLVAYRNSIVDEHPDWQMLDYNGNTIDDHGPCMDWMSPWGDELIARLLEVTNKYDIDGFWFDGYTYQTHGGMSGKYAAKRYKEDTGRDLPKKYDLQDENYRRWIAWRGEVLADYLGRVQREVRKVKPDVAIVYNALRLHMWPWSYQWGYEAVERVADMPSAEYTLYIGQDPVHKRFMMARLRGVRGDKPAMAWILPTMAHTESPPAPAAETNSRIYQCLTQRLAIGLAYQPGPARQMKEIVDNVNKRAPFLKKAQDVKWAALVVTERDDWFYGLTERVTEYRDNYEGIFRILCEMHVPVDVISESDIETSAMAKYAVVILPGQHCLSDKAINALKDYVSDGGGLVATDMSSRWDEWANLRKDFGLADVFGSSYIGQGSIDKKGQEDRLIEVNVKHPVFSGTDMADTLVSNAYDRSIGSTIIMKDGHGVVTEPTSLNRFGDRDVMGMKGCPGRILVTRPRPGSEPIAWLLDGKSRRTWPAGYANRFGKGRVVYFPMNLGGMYAITNYPQWRVMFDQACRFVAGSEPAMEADAPLDVQFEPTYQPAEKRFVIHLLNDHLQSLSFLGQDRRVRQDLPLIAGIKIKIRGIPVTESYAEPGHQKLNIEQKGDKTLIEIPPLADHTMVIFSSSSGN